jgi:acyl transferase domain-containing protein
MNTEDAGREAAAEALDAVAIIGMAGRFPGAESIEEYWRILRDGVESISPVSVQEMLDAGVDPAAAHDPHRVAAASTLADVECFDSGFFDVSPKQAELTDPQQRLFLECAWEALESAGYDPATRGHRIGVFAGSSISTYLLFHLYLSVSSVNRSSDLQVLLGNDKDYLATQVAYKLGLTGPAVNVQTACSTSLVAVHLACQSLLNRECDVALAGGVTVRLPARAGYLHDVGGILSPDGHCRPFDADAQGTVFGSGVGMVVLKRLAEALADGDVIDAVIRGSAINNDGSLKAGSTAPSEDGQAQVVAEAMAMAAVEPATIGYVEMHGTGTPLGDPIEVAALTRAFRSRAAAHRLAPEACAIGAVKSNVGHLESAAGVAGLVKTVLALTHRQIPPTLHFTRPNPAIDFAQTPFYVNTRLSPWPPGRTPRRAGVSSFGIGGTNAHVVLEEAPAPAVPEERSDGQGADRPYLLPLSARDPAALAALAQRYRDFLAADGSGANLALRDVCWSAGTRRRHHEHRLAAVGRTRDELVAQLAAVDAEQAGTVPVTRGGHRRKVVFVFPGQGSQWIGMGRQVLEREPVFRAAVQSCDRVAHGHTGWSLLAELTRDDGDQSWLQRTDRVQLALFAIQVGLAAWWRSLGIQPDAVVGHSMGEVAATHVAGALSLEDAVRVLHHRNRLIHPTLGRGKMMAVGLTPQQASGLLAGHAAQASIAIVNSPKSAVLSGDPTVLESIAATLRERETFHRWISVDFASHSPQMDPLVGPLREALRDIRARQASIPIISTVTGEPIDATLMDAGYWARNLREPVQFADATRWLREHDFDVFVEISPHPILLPSIEDSLYHLDRPATAVASLHRDSDEQRSLLQALAALYRTGQDILWDQLYPQDRHFVRLPAYPWQRRRHWVDPPQDTAPATGSGPVVHPLLGRRLRSALKDVQFEASLGPLAVPYLDDHRVCGRAVFPAAGYLEMLWQAAAIWEPGPHVVTDLVMHDLLSFAGTTSHLVQTILTPSDDGGGRLELFGWEPASAAWRPHVTARVRAARPDDESPAPDLNEVHDRCPREIPPAAYYERLRAEGLEYGSRFRGIESLRVGDGEVIGRVRLPEAVAGDADRYGMHPALLDACLQLIGAAFAGNDLAATATAGDGGGHVYLPVGVGSFRVVAPAQTLVSAHVVIGDETDGDTKTGEVRLYDERGRAVAEVLGLRVKRVSRSALRRALQDYLSDWCYELRWRGQPRPDTAPRPPHPDQATQRGRWLILADRDGVARALAAQLEQRGDAVTMVVPAGRDDAEPTPATVHIDPMNPDDFTAMLARDGTAYRDVIYLWGLDATPAEHTTAQSLASDEALICGGALHLAQALLRHPWAASSRLWLVTRSAQAPQPSGAPLAPAQAPLWGLGRTLGVEHPDLRCVRVDLDTTGVDDNARSLLAEADAAGRDARRDGRADGPEDQIAFRNGERFVARLIRTSARTPAHGARVPPAGRSLQLVIPTRGTLDALAFETSSRRAPAAGEVEIRVRATGLNFRDVLNALGAYPGDPGPLGLECAGEICAVGDGVDEYRVGDPVLALAHGCFGTFVTVPAVLVAGKPERLSYAEAASVPIAFLTAYYGLCQLAQIGRGDRVLIHSAAGGLGLAATQLALRAGAEVFATAGSEAKRAYLRSLGLRHVMRSRTLDFAAEVMEATGGYGVDIVLNALTGEYIPRNLSVLATGGRFVEVGKIGVWDADRVSQARPDASYFLLDLGEEARRDPALIGGMLRDLMREFHRGTLHPLPLQVFASHEVTGAFRFMAQAKHTGKIVVTQQVGLSPSAADRFRADASYLITGGLGGLGRQVARWMVDQGARHVALLGRGGPSAAAQAVVEELTGAGAQVLVIAADVAEEDQVAHALRTIRDSMPSLRGIVHAAGVLDDGILLRQDWPRFAGVLAPKVQGAWHLHAQTRRADLDFFVLFSSISSIWGSAGQSSYAAANAFLDTLAHARRSQGLPALSINWGGWSQVGLAAGDEVTGRMAGQGMAAITPDAGVAALEQAMRQQAAQLAVVPIDWAAFLARFPADRIPVLLAELSREARGRPGGDLATSGASDLLRRLDAAGPHNRRRVLAAYLTEQARLALGLDPQAPLDPRRPLNELGLDSLMAIEVRSRLSSAVGRLLPATILFDYPTIEGLTGHLAGEVLNLPDGGASNDGAAADAPAALPPNECDARAGAMDVARLSADEVEAVLAQELLAVQALLTGDPS